MINYAEKMILLEGQPLRGDYIIHLLDTEEQLQEEIKRIHQIKNSTNQPMTEFSRVFKKGASYPTDPDAFYQERRDRNGKVMGWYVMVYKPKKNKKKAIQKTYDWKEDVEYKLQILKEKEVEDILIVHVDEGVSADYYYKKNIAKVWG